MSKKSGANKVNLDHTHKLFLDIAYKEFVTHGYAEASTSRIVDASGMARGSLYYHFKDKKDVFRAIVTDTMSDIGVELQKVWEAEQSPDLALIALAKRYFEICADTQRGRIAFVDSLAVLGAAECHQINQNTIRPVLTKAVGAIVDMGGFQGRNKNMMAMFLFSSLTESGRIVQSLPNRDMAQQQFFDTFEWVLARIL